MLAMSFLTANFKWILLAVVLFAMLIVGYVADKTDFGHKKTSKKEIENPNKVEEIDLDNLKGKTLSDMVSGSNEEKAADINDDLNAPFGDVVDSNSFDMPTQDSNINDALYQPLSEDLNAPLTNTNEDLNAPFGDASTVDTPEATPDVNADIMNSDIFTPITPEVPSVPEALDVPEATEPAEVIKEEVTVPEEVPVESPVEAPEEVIIPEVTIDTIPEETPIETPVEAVEAPIEAPVETIETPIEPPLVNEEVKEENITDNNVFDVQVDKLVEEANTVDTSKKSKKKSKKESNTYTEEFDAEVVPEVITEKFDDGNNSEITTEDDIWKF